MRQAECPRRSQPVSSSPRETEHSCPFTAHPPSAPLSSRPPPRRQANCWPPGFSWSLRCFLAASEHRRDRLERLEAERQCCLLDPCTSFAHLAQFGPFPGPQRHGPRGALPLSWPAAPSPQADREHHRHPPGHRHRQRPKASPRCSVGMRGRRA